MFDELIEEYETSLDMLDGVSEFDLERIAYLNGVSEGILKSMEIVDWDMTMEYLDRRRFELLDVDDDL